MFIHVLSPHNCEPVKIRQQDVGRAVRDSHGEIFYVLPRSDGKGYYASPIRAHNPKQEQRYLKMEAQSQVARQGGQDQNQTPIHNAAGQRRANWGRRLFLIFILILLATLAWALTIGPLQHLLVSQSSSPSTQPSAQSQPPAGATP